MARQPDPYGTLSRDIKDILRRLARLEGASAYTRSGMAPTSEGVTTVGGTLDVEGNLVVNGPTELNGATAVGGTMTVDGDLDVTGGFSLPDSVIQDSWLANLVGFGTFSSSTGTAWSTSTSLADKASTSTTVPSGFDTALIFAWGEVVFQDSAPNGFKTRVAINGSAGPTVQNLANLVGATTVMHKRLISVTPGSTLTISTQVSSTVATGGSSANQAVIDGFVLYQR